MSWGDQLVPENPAFPAKGWDEEHEEVRFRGMTLRHWTATQILIGIISGSTVALTNKEVWAKQAVEWADALINEQNQQAHEEKKT